jgi:D-3-phosphoglycerate dehydrogenase
MLAVFRNIARSDRLFHQGVWWKNGGFQLTGKKIGIIGFGAVGSRVATLLKAFRCSILVNEIDIQKDSAIRSANFEKTSLEDLLKTCDAVSLHVPLSPFTFHLLDSTKLALLKPGAILINTSRGKVLDQNALKVALMGGKLAGAGLDVFEEEPVRDSELFKIDNLVATAHMAGNCEEAVYAMGRAAIDGAREFLFNRRH